ncbi:hypothetical protein SO802_018849 [Lithocarpus litseifolius]|uniref:Uncharacterized protein n=1 Tax=Lithocarpus litseifolius TaxID=425828 RepID=A0AAW2CMG8_9ROSI
MVVWYIYDKLLYVRFYGIGNYIVGAHRLWFIISWYYFEKLCVSSFNHSCYIIIENDLVVFNLQFPKLKHVLQIVYHHETCISPTPINYATYWALAHPNFQQFYK